MEDSHRVAKKKKAVTKRAGPAGVSMARRSPGVAKHPTIGTDVRRILYQIPSFSYAVFPSAILREEPTVSSNKAENIKTWKREWWTLAYGVPEVRTRRQVSINAPNYQ